MAADFKKYNVGELQTFLKDRGIQLSDDGKRKRKKELIQLCENAEAMKQPKIEVPVEDVSAVIKHKLQTNESQLPNPNDVVVGWTHNFSEVPEFTFGHMYSYLIGKDEQYTEETLRSFKSLTGFKLFRDGHVTDLKYNSVNSDYCFFKFCVKPSEKTKTEDGLQTYNGFVVMRENAEIHSAYCPCKGGIDGLCKHVAAALFDLQATVCNNIFTTCTSQKCVWTRRQQNDEYAIKLEDLNVIKAEFGKEEKTYLKPHQFDPRCIVVNQDTKRDRLRSGLQQVCPEAVALMFLEEPNIPETHKTTLDEHMNSDLNVTCTETVQNVSVYSMVQYGELFKSEYLHGDHGQHAMQYEKYDENVILKFMDFIDIGKEQINVICDKTTHQGQSQFWFDQRAGRITASNFYKVCHLRQTTDRTNTVKLLMNYCPILHAPEQLEWGHEKEDVAADAYYKKLSKKHKDLSLSKCGLVINQQWPYLGASPDRIRYCACHGKVLVECKSLFAKRNLLPDVAASDKLQKTPDGVVKLKEETSWFYQIQGQMAITEIGNTDLIIYTNKNILIVPVSFNERFWETVVLEKLQLFFKRFLAPEILSRTILKTISIKGLEAEE